MSPVSPRSGSPLLAATERALALLIWIVVLPGVSLRRLGESGRLGDTSSGTGASWRAGRGSLAAATAVVDRGRLYSSASLWLATRRALRRILGARSTP